jgi:hypothetical protein
VTALAPKLTSAQAEDALGPVRSALGWSTSTNEAQEWVKAFAALLARLPDSKPSGQMIVDVMKFPITAGAPSDSLLLALQSYFPSLPGPVAGMRANLEWLKQNERSINLDSRAVCPFPPRDQLHCPVQTATFDQ